MVAGWPARLVFNITNVKNFVALFVTCACKKLTQVYHELLSINDVKDWH